MVPSLLMATSLVFFGMSLAFAVPSARALESESKINPTIGKHLYRHYCAVCHGNSGKGNGINADHLGDVHPTDLTTPEFDKYDDGEIYEVIDGGGAAVDISYYMPPWGGVFTENQMHSLVAYIRTLSEEKGRGEVKPIRLPDLGKKGKGECAVCHAKETNLLTPIAPNIGHEGSKLKPEWLTEFLKKPDRIRPIGFMPLTKAKMPNFFFSDEELAAVVAYMMTLKDEGISPNVLRGWDSSEPAEIEEGEFLYTDEYACDGCHKKTSDGEGGVVGPVLSDAMKRIQPEWLFYWIKHPQAIRPDTPMPNFRMPDKEVRAILAYLYSFSDESPRTATVAGRTPASAELLAKGKKIVASKNCKGCHRIDSFNSALLREDRNPNPSSADPE
ncbi:MAG: c-type cytochrome [Nitrospira sp.]|nr:c-type cytochrome [Candidatus Manganitrophaceae bacterium]HIL34047.1 c-type cytochrome [Candidatus Manganitrophaceae bacterium]